MKKLFCKSLLIALLGLAGCALTGAVLGPSPEAQITNGANSHKAASTLGTVLLRNKRITVVQAKSYSAILHTASTHLDNAFAALETCRKATGSNEKTQPDPCSAKVEDDIRLAVSVVSEVQKTLNKAQE